MLGKAFKKEPKCYNLGDISEGVRRGNCPLLPSLGSAPGTNDHRFKCKQQRGSHIRERESSSLAAYSHLVDEAKFLANNFAVVKFLHIRRQSNSIVHNIARHSRYISKFSI